jgi:hypothetical protein
MAVLAMTAADIFIAGQAFGRPAGHFAARLAAKIKIKASTATQAEIGCHNNERENNSREPKP